MPKMPCDSLSHLRNGCDVDTADYVTHEGDSALVPACSTVPVGLQIRLYLSSAAMPVVGIAVVGRCRRV